MNRDFEHNLVTAATLALLISAIVLAVFNSFAFTVVFALGVFIAGFDVGHYHRHEECKVP